MNDIYWHNVILIEDIVFVFQTSEFFCFNREDKKEKKSNNDKSDNKTTVNVYRSGVLGFFKERNNLFSSFNRSI